MNRNRLVVYVFVGLVLISFTYVSTYGPEWTGSDDEGFRLHAAWLTASGQLPYRDFFDNQMPNFSLLSAPLVWLVGPHPGPLRGFTWLFFGLAGVVFLHFESSDSSTLLAGSLGLLLLGLSSVTARVAMEFRPDLPAVALAVLSFFLLERTRKASDHTVWSAGAGLLLAVAVLVKPTALILLPACGYLLVARNQPAARHAIKWFSTLFLLTLSLQLILWGLLSDHFLEYTILTHQLSLPTTGTRAILLDTMINHLPILVGLIVFVWSFQPRSTIGMALLLSGLTGLVFYLLFPPNTPQSRHLFGVVLCLAYPAGEAYASLLRRYLPALDHWTPIVCSVHLVITVALILLQSPLTHRPHVKNLADWISNQTSSGAHVLTDFSYVNFLAKRPQPPALANVSSNLTYTGYINQTRIKRALRETPPELIVLQLKPHPWHLANVPGMEGIILDWMSEYDFTGIRTPANTVSLVFTKKGRSIEGTGSTPEQLRKKLLPLLNKYEWNRLLERLIPEPNGTHDQRPPQ